LINDIQKYKSLFKTYTELRIHENRTKNIVLLNGDCIKNTENTAGGVSSRVFVNGSWGLASSPEIKDGSIKKVIDHATENAKFLGEKYKRDKNIVVNQSNVKEIKDFTTKKDKYSNKDLMNFLKTVDNNLTTKYKDLKVRNLILNTLDMEKQLLTSNGTESFQMIPRSFLYVILSVEKDNIPISLSQSYGGFGQFEDVNTSLEKLFEGINFQYEELKKKADGIFPTAGVKDVILDADLAGILAHEAIGHTTEADIVLGGSVAADYLNKEVASPLVTLVDYANTAFGKRCPVPVYVDDEGIKAKDAVIIERGILRSYMHNRESANYYKTESTGNARAFGFSDEPLIRMRNTCINPGNDKLKDMIESIEDGYYLKKPGNGQADSTSEFMFAVTMGYEIKNGKLGKAIKNTTISGIAFELLKTITMVSDELKWISSGMCGKKQHMPVGMGGPAIKCKVNIGGK